MFSGFYIHLQTPERAARWFVTPAILADTVAAVISAEQDKDPQDEMEIKIYWGENCMRPSYTVGEATNQIEA
jgi:hypothetical protein